jgi:hypothetical protein
MTSPSESDVRESEPGDARTPLPLRRWLNALPSAATPAALVLTGMLYSTGWAERFAVLRSFGFEGSEFEPSFQTTLARGYPSILFGAIPLGALLLAMWLIYRLWNSSRADGPLMRMFAKFARGSLILLGIAMLLVFATFCGLLSGQYRAHDISVHVETGCYNSCFYYVVDQKSYLGLPIMADEKHVAIYTQEGTIVFPQDRVVKIVPRWSVAEESRIEFSVWPFGKNRK